MGACSKFRRWLFFMFVCLFMKSKNKGDDRNQAKENVSFPKYYLQNLEYSLRFSVLSTYFSANESISGKKTFVVLSVYVIKKNVINLLYPQNMLNVYPRILKNLLLIPILITRFDWTLCHYRKVNWEFFMKFFQKT